MKKSPEVASEGIRPGRIGPSEIGGGGVESGTRGESRGLIIEGCKELKRGSKSEKESSESRGLAEMRKKSKWQKWMGEIGEQLEVERDG